MRRERAPLNRIAMAVSLLRQELIELHGERGRLDEIMRQQQERIAILTREIERLESTQNTETKESE